MAVEITGSGYNSKVKLYNIHQGNGYFRKDTSTTHSQVKLLQSALTDLGYDTQGADGKYGNNTLAAVKKFQEANNLTADGLFGKNSLTALESILGTHLDPENCETLPDRLQPLISPLRSTFRISKATAILAGSMVLDTTQARNSSTARGIHTKRAVTKALMDAPPNITGIFLKRERFPVMMTLKSAWRCFSRVAMIPQRNRTWVYTQAKFFFAEN